jgi:hypothetical protein
MFLTLAKGAAKLTHRYRKSQNRLLKVCYVPATSAHLPRHLFLLLQPLTALIKQRRQYVLFSSLYYLDFYELTPTATATVLSLVTLGNATHISVSSSKVTKASRNKWRHGHSFASIFFSTLRQCKRAIKTSKGSFTLAYFELRFLKFASSLWLQKTTRTLALRQILRELTCTDQ